jgi:hypothetical protein
MEGAVVDSERPNGIVDSKTFAKIVQFSLSFEYEEILVLIIQSYPPSTLDISSVFQSSCYYRKCSNLLPKYPP